MLHPIGEDRDDSDIGSDATTTITGLENVILNGVNHAGDAVTEQAKLDLGLARISLLDGFLGRNR